MPLTYFGPNDEQYRDYAFENNANLGRWPLGHTLILPDRREYKFTLNDGTVEVAGNLYQSVVALSGHTNRTVQTAVSAGDTQVNALLATTVAGTDIYAEGVVHVNDSQSNNSQGYVYRIQRAFAPDAAHASALSTGILTVNLASGDTVQVAMDTSAQVSFTRNRYHQALIHDSPATAQLTGVSPGVAAAGRYYWSQVKGYCSIAQQGAMLDGNRVMPSITTDGMVETFKRRVRSVSTTIIFLSTAPFWGIQLEDQDGSGSGAASLLAISSVASALVPASYDITAAVAYNGPDIGVCIKQNSDGEFCMIDLNIE